MKWTLLVLLFCTCGCVSARKYPTPAMTPVKTYVIKGVKPQKQRTNMDCWITCAAILKSWKDGRAIKPSHLAKDLGEPWTGFFLEDTGLAREHYRDFARVMGLRYQWPANWIPEGYIELLQKHGPLWIASGVSSHARILYGVTESKDGPVMLFIDPATGSRRKQAFKEFFPEFEREAVLIVGHRPDLALPVQILHY